MIDKNKPVLVTGATGYVAGWIIKRLLDEGLTVHACVRNPNNKDKLNHLDQLKSSSTGDIKYFKADLLENGSFQEAMKGCSIVFHTASPFTYDFKDPQKELVDPAKLGTRNVLGCVNSTESVKRVVLTSSCAAVYGDNVDLMSIPNKTLTEENWNTSSSLKHNPYSFSKTVAEKEAMTICSSQSRWKLVILNPSLVFGPSLNPFSTSESFDIMRQFGNGVMKIGVPDISLGIVDVRDLSEAHFRAAFDENAIGRYIISGHNTSMLKISRILMTKYKDYPLPPRALPKFLAWLFVPIFDKNTTRKFIRRNVNYEFRADSSKSINQLQMVYRPLEESVLEMFQQLIETKQISS